MLVQWVRKSAHDADVRSVRRERIALCSVSEEHTVKAIPVLLAAAGMLRRKRTCRNRSHLDQLLRE